MDDKQVDVAIIEASALLVTLIFIILSFYSSNFTQFFTTWEQQCTLSQQQCTSPSWLGALSAQVATLEFLAYNVGFFFVMAASVATIRLFSAGSGWRLAGLRLVELVFFLSGLGTLAMMFFLRASRDAISLVVLLVVTLGAIVGPLWWAHHRRQVIEAGGST